MFWQILLILTTIAALALLHGIRGRCIATQPSCRRCRFTLVGLDPQRFCCPECGADLTRRRAIRTHRRRVRFVMVLPALVVLVVSSAGAAYRLGVDNPDLKLQHYKPGVVLALEARYGESERSSEALNEALRRLASSELSAWGMRSYARHALAIQADRERAWDQRWGDLLEGARAQGLLSDEHWQRYGSQVYHVTMSPRAVVRVGEPASLLLHEEWRAGRWSHIQTVVTAGQPVLDDEPTTTHEQLRPGAGGQRYRHRVWRVGYGQPGSPFSLPNYPRPSRTGAAVLRLPIRVDVVELDSRRSPAGSTDRRSPAELLLAAAVTVDSRTIVLAAPIIVVKSDVETIRFIDDPELGQQLAAVLAESYRVPSGHEPLLPKIRTLRAYPTDGELPVPIAFEVFAREEGKEVLIGRVHARGRLWHIDGSQTGFLTHPLPPELELRRMDLVFRPSSDVARQTTELTEIWGGEIVVPGIVIGGHQQQRQREGGSAPAAGDSSEGPARRGWRR